MKQAFQFRSKLTYSKTFDTCISTQCKNSSEELHYITVSISKHYHTLIKKQLNTELRSANIHSSTLACVQLYILLGGRTKFDDIGEQSAEANTWRYAMN